MRSLGGAPRQKKGQRLIGRAAQWRDLRLELPRDGSAIDVAPILQDPRFVGFRATADWINGRLERVVVGCPLGARLERVFLDGRVVVIYDAKPYMWIEEAKADGRFIGRESAHKKKAVIAEVNRAAELLLGRIVRDGRPTGPTVELPQVASADAEWRKQSGRDGEAPTSWLRDYLYVSQRTAQRLRARDKGRQRPSG